MSDVKRVDMKKLIARAKEVRDCWYNCQYVMKECRLCQSEEKFKEKNK